MFPVRPSHRVSSHNISSKDLSFTAAREMLQRSHEDTACRISCMKTVCTCVCARPMSCAVHTYTPACIFTCAHCVHAQELSMHGKKLGMEAERIRQAGASGSHKQNVERDCMRALNGVLDLVSWLELDLYIIFAVLVCIV